MSKESRVKKSLLNARINLICYFVSLLVAFFTRKIFLDQFGTEFIGLNGTLQSLLGFLNIAELGLGTAISYVLYQPIYNDDKIKINEVISVFGYLYRCIGLFIIGAGITLSLFLPWIFPNTCFSWEVIYFGFYAYLVSSALGYLVNYKQILLAADQKNYIVTGYFQVATTTKTIIQMGIALTICNFYLYLTMEVIFGIINSVILQWKINVTYPWLQSETRYGKQLLKKYPEIGRYVSQLFVHKIAGFIQYQLSPFLVYVYVSLPVVAIYGNYVLITQGVRSFINSILNSTSAGVGSLISEGNKEKIYSIYKELLSFRVFIAGFFSISIYILIDTFIEIWLGDEYKLAHVITILICIQFFMMIVREVTDQFIFGYGLFYDTWAPIVESAIFIICSIFLGAIYGLSGILSATLISIFAIVYLWKPYFLFSKGFHRSVIHFWLFFVKNLFTMGIAAFLSKYLFDYFGDSFSLCEGWYSWLWQTFVFCLLTGIISFGCFYGIIPNFRSFCKRFYSIQA